ncbi:MAG: FHA domain-containing protein [Lentisphaeria bacterium]
MLTLIVIRGSLKGQFFPLKPGEHILGRSHSAFIKFEEEDVSGKHCVIKVADGKATIEILSRAGIKIDGQQVENRVELQHGNVIEIGADNALRFESNAETVGSTKTRVPESAVVNNEANTINISDQANADDDQEQLTMVGAARNFENLRLDVNRLKKSQAAASAEDAAGHTMLPGDGTQVMHTRFASQDEIAGIRDASMAKSRRRLGVMVSLLVIVVVTGILLWPKQPEPELNVRWPQDANGKDLMEMQASLLGSAKEGGIDLMIPAGMQPVLEKTDQLMNITTCVGKERDIPMQISFERYEDPRNLSCNRSQALTHWMNYKRNSNENWNFGAPMPLGFMGYGNGIPFLQLTYRRQAPGSGGWGGRLLFFRHGSISLIHRVEVPEVELSRCSWILSLTMLKISPDLCLTYWEGSDQNSSGTAEEYLNRARNELRKVSPGAWCSVLNDIWLALCKTPANAPMQVEAYELMRGLRLLQGQWFNAQLLNYYSAQTDGNKEELAKVVAICRAVFNDPNDARYYTVRKVRW